MAWLPLANILHHKVRSVFSALGIGIGICMLVTLSGLSRGSLDEVAARWESVDAELILYPRGWGENLTTISGIGLSDRYARRALDDCRDDVERAVPVFLWQVNLAGQDHLAVGVDPDQWDALAGGRPLLAGRIFDPEKKFTTWIEHQLLAPAGQEDAGQPREISKAELAAPEHCGLEIVIDSRLAEAGNFSLHQTVFFADHHWKIVGIAPSGVLSRVFMPRRIAQYLFASGSITKSTLVFVKLRPGAAVGAAARKLRRLGPEVARLEQYRHMLRQRFGIMFHYVDAVNAVALVLAFLFIMITLYTIVLQRTREIAILKSCGASNGFVLGGVLAESALLTGAGALAGVALSFLAGWLIEQIRPLLTVVITWQWIAVAMAAAIAGAVLSAIYPAWRATRVDMVEVLTLE